MNPVAPTVDAVFPGFASSCSALHEALLPFAFAILVIGMVLDFWDGADTPEAVLKIVIRSFLIAVFILKSEVIINEGQSLIKGWIEEKIPARPEKVAERYKEKLREAQKSCDRKGESFLRRVMKGNWYEGIIVVVMTLISWVAMVLVAIVYNIQRAVLLASWAISPLLIPCLAVRPVFGIGLQHVLRLLGIMLWPLGLALAATFTDGLIDVIGGGTSFADASPVEAVGKGLTGILGIFVLAVWIVFSTILAPFYIQRLVAGFGVPTAQLMRYGDMVGSAVAGSYLLARNHFSRSSDPSPQPASNGGPSGGSSSGSNDAQESPPPPAPSSPPSNSSSQGASASPNSDQGRGHPSDPAGDRAVQSIVDRFTPRRF